MQRNFYLSRYQRHFSLPIIERLLLRRSLVRKNDNGVSIEANTFNVAGCRLSPTTYPSATKLSSFFLTVGLHHIQSWLSLGNRFPELVFIKVPSRSNAATLVDGSGLRWMPCKHVSIFFCHVKEEGGFSDCLRKKGWVAKRNIISVLS